jgi:hypothetical protein
MKYGRHRLFTISASTIALTLLGGLAAGQPQPGSRDGGKSMSVGTSKKASKVFPESASKVSNRTPSASQATMTTVWSEGELLSKAEVTFCELGFRIKSQIGTSFWSIKDPGSAVLMNPENKVYLKEPVGEYIAELREDWRPVPPSKISSATKTELPDKIKGKRYTCVLPAKSDDGQEVTAAEFICMDMKLPPAVNQMWCNFLTLEYSPKRGVPVAMKQLMQRRQGQKKRKSKSLRPPRIVTIIEPRQIKELPLDPSFFEIPKGFHRSKDRASLYFSVDGNIKKDDIEDLFMQPLK